MCWTFYEIQSPIAAWLLACETIHALQNNMQYVCDCRSAGAPDHGRLRLLPGTLALRAVRSCLCDPVNQCPACGDLCLAASAAVSSSVGHEKG